MGWCITVQSFAESSIPHLLLPWGFHGRLEFEDDTIAENVFWNSFIFGERSSNSSPHMATNMTVTAMISSYQLRAYLLGSDNSLLSAYNLI